MSDPVDVGRLLDRLGLKAVKRGRSWWVCCPFHTEKTPSCRIRDEEGHPKHAKWKCFGCEEGGSHVYLVQRMLGFETARDAWQWITTGTSDKQPIPEAVRAGLTTKVHVREQPTSGFHLPFGCMLDIPLEGWPAAALGYARHRCITDEQAAAFRLGYALDGRCRNRIILPVIDARGRLVSYTGRSWRRDAERKYLEPKTEENAERGTIFGAHRWTDRDTVFLTEGGLNALAIDRAVCHRVHVGALMGSNFEPEHAVQLASWRRVVIASDPDSAGEKMRRAVAALRRHVTIAHLAFPPKGDANGLEIEHGIEALRELIRQQLPDGPELAPCGGAPSS